MSSVWYPKEFAENFADEESQLRALGVMLRKLDALETALKLRNAPGILHSSNRLATELLLLGFAEVAQVVSMINDAPLDEMLAEEFSQKLQQWKNRYLIKPLR